MNIKTGVALVSAVFLFLLDRILKNWAVNSLYNQKISLIKEWLEMELFQNKNIAFSIKIPEFIIVPVIVLIIIGLAYYFIKAIKSSHIIKATSFLFVIIGAISNLYDRLQFGYVIDFINFKYWPVFNIADVMISAGIIGLIWTLFYYKNTNKR